MSEKKPTTNKKTRSPLSKQTFLTEKEAGLLKKDLTRPDSTPRFMALPHRTVEWLGGVNHDNLDRVISNIKHLMIESPEEIHLLVNSGGGATGIGMSFFDAMTTWLRPRLTTIGSGDVDSSGIIIFLAGEKRYITKNTTMFFHLAGRTFGTEKRFSTSDMETMLKEDSLKNHQYASVVASRTNGKYTAEEILDLMTKNTLITPEQAVEMGLAHEILH